MDIKNLADLAKLAALCRKKGIESLKISSDGIEFKLGSEPIKAHRKQFKPLNDDKELESKPLSEEDILFWSSSGIPDQPNEGIN